MTLVNVWDIFGWHDMGFGRPGRLLNIPQGPGWSPTRRTTWPQISAVPRPRKPVSAETNQLTKRKMKNKKPKRNQTFNSRKVTLLFLLTPSKQKPGQTETGPEVRPHECELTSPWQLLGPLALAVPTHRSTPWPPSLPLQLPLSPPLHSLSWGPTFISKSQFSAMALGVWGSSASATRV